MNELITSKKLGITLVVLSVLRFPVMMTMNLHFNVGFDYLLIPVMVLMLAILIYRKADKTGRIFIRVICVILGIIYLLFLHFFGETKSMNTHYFKNKSDRWKDRPILTVLEREEMRSDGHFFIHVVIGEKYGNLIYREDAETIMALEGEYPASESEIPFAWEKEKVSLDFKNKVVYNLEKVKVMDSKEFDERPVLDYTELMDSIKTQTERAKK